MDPITIAAIISAISGMIAATKKNPADPALPPEAGVKEALQMPNTGVAAMENSAGGAPLSPAFASRTGPTPPPPPMLPMLPHTGQGGVGARATPEGSDVPSVSKGGGVAPGQAETSAKTDTHVTGAETPNIAPPVGGNTGGGNPDLYKGTYLTPGSVEGGVGAYEGTLLEPGTIGGGGNLTPEKAAAIAGGQPDPQDPRIQDWLSAAGPIAGIAGAAMAPGGGPSPAGATLPGRPFQMGNSLEGIIALLKKARSNSPYGPY